MEIEAMLAAYLNRDEPVPDWCKVSEYQVSGGDITIYYTFPTLNGTKSADMTVSLLEVMAWLWTTIPEPSVTS